MATRAQRLPSRKPIWLLIALALLLLLWYLFRPELLFIDRTVDEPPPGSGITPAPLFRAARPY